MNTIIISLCGPPASGKRTILDQIAHHTLSLSHIYESQDLVGKRFINITYRNYIIHIQSFIGIPENVIRESFYHTDAVIYVLNANWTHDWVSPMAKAEGMLFKRYLDTAKSVKKTHRDIPWIFILNKLDIAPTSTILHQLPVHVAAQAVQCVAREGKGIPELWLRITQLIDNDDR
jgi:hypothetical protein